MQRIRRLVGPITREQLRYVDWALASDLGVFVPVAGPCGYATTPEHAHPAWSFVVFAVDHGEVHEWNMAVNGREAAQPRVSF